MLKGESIICISTMNWNDLWTRKQRFMDMLSKNGNKILYVEPFSWVKGNKLRDKFITVFKNVFLQPFGRLQKISETLYVLKLSLAIPFKKRFYIAAFLNGVILKYQIRTIVKKLNFTQPLLWVYDPFDRFIIDGFNEKIVIYDCVDDHSAYPGVKREFVKKIEEMLVKRADLVFVTAVGLYEDKKHLNEKIFVIPNGVDVEHLKKAQEEKTIVPDDLLAVPRPRIGYIGAIADWIDLDLISYIAESSPEWSLVLIGPIIAQRNLDFLKKAKNIYFLGRKDLQILPNYLKGLDICLNPFKLNELSKKVNPLKVYEYLAAGKAVISTDMPEVRKFEGIVKFGYNKEDFIKLIDETLKEDQSELRKKRLGAVLNYSWDKLLSAVVSHIESHGKFKKNG